MSEVILIGITQNKGGDIVNMDSVDAIKGKGLLRDRKYADKNSKFKQLTLIEIENIDYYNHTLDQPIKPLYFRRNIVTKGVNLNTLVNKEFFIGEVRLKGHDLCRPCKYLQSLLEKKNFVKELLLKGGLRCEILTSGKIFVNDLIKIND